MGEEFENVSMGAIIRRHEVVKGQIDQINELKVLLVLKHCGNKKEGHIQKKFENIGDFAENWPGDII